MKRIIAEIDITLYKRFKIKLIRDGKTIRQFIIESIKKYLGDI